MLFLFARTNCIIGTKTNRSFTKYRYGSLDFNKKSHVSLLSSNNRQKNIDTKETIFFESSPSLSELIIPFISILTVIGIIPFIATLFRQFWVRYTITNRRISVDSGFNRKNHIEIVYRDIKKITYISRFGGVCADVVIVLKDGSRLELRSLSNWEKNINFIKSNCSDDVTFQ